MRLVGLALARHVMLSALCFSVAAQEFKFRIEPPAARVSTASVHRLVPEVGRTIPTWIQQLARQGALSVRLETGAFAPLDAGLAFLLLPEEAKFGLHSVEIWNRQAGYAIASEGYLGVAVHADQFLNFGFAAFNPISRRALFTSRRDATLPVAERFDVESGRSESRISFDNDWTIVGVSPDANFVWLMDVRREGKFRRVGLPSGNDDWTIDAGDAARPFDLQAFSTHPSDPNVVAITGSFGPLANQVRIYHRKSINQPIHIGNRILGPGAFDARGRFYYPSDFLTICNFQMENGRVDCAATLLSTLFGGPLFLFGELVFAQRANPSQLFHAQSGEPRGAVTAGQMEESVGSGLMLSGNELRRSSDFSLVGRFPHTIYPDKKTFIHPDWIILPWPGGPVITRAVMFRKPPVIASNGIVAAANSLPGSICNAQVISIYGENIGPSEAAGPYFQSPNSIGARSRGTEVFFEGIPGAILYAGQNQINVIVPDGVKEYSTIRLGVLTQGLASNALRLPVSPYCPALFATRNSSGLMAIALHPDASLVSAARPATRGSVVTLFATGMGTPDIYGFNEVALRAAQLGAPLLVEIGGRRASVVYVGASPGLVAALHQINVAIPIDAPTGEAIPVRISVGEFRAEAVLLPVR